MGKLEYLDALKRAMTGLAPEAQAKTLAFYEQRFVDGVAAGRTEADIAAELDDPKKIAMTLRANTHMQAFETKKTPGNTVRMLVAVLGLAIFNLFMVVPAMVYAALLATLYACGLAFYLAGTVITASGLSGANEIKLDGPLRHVFISDEGFGEDASLQTKVNISEQGIRIFSERATDGKSGTTVSVNDAAGKHATAAARAAARAAATAAATAGAEAARIAAEAGANAASDAGAAAQDAVLAAEDAARAAADAARDAASAINDEDDERDSDKRAVRVIKRAESVASQGIVFSTDMDDGSRATQTFFGLFMVLGGILLLLLSLVVTRYTFIGIKRYIDMNFSLLKGH
jgi:uncharacterized membrane protein